MGFLGMSLIVASVVFFCLRPPSWLPAYLGILKRRWRGGVAQRPAVTKQKPDGKEGCEPTIPSDGDHTAREGPLVLGATNGYAVAAPRPIMTKADLDRAAMPPPPVVPGRRIALPPSDEADQGEQTTPKALVAPGPGPVPTFSLSDFASASPPPTTSATSTSPISDSILMPPPPRPPTLRRLPGQKNASAPTPVYASSRALPIPSRGGSASSSSGSLLAPPPTHSTKPAKPSRQVVLQPGHSPLDWARLSGSPRVDLRGLPPDTPYLRVTPSQLGQQNGRHGRDAWMALNGHVYNVTPYLPFHPGGVGELLRGGGRDGTRLFGEVHPWVNYEGMLAACLVGILVAEEEATAVQNDMEQMD